MYDKESTKDRPGQKNEWIVWVTISEIVGKNINSRLALKLGETIHIALKILYKIYFQNI